MLVGRAKQSSWIEEEGKAAAAGLPCSPAALTAILRTKNTQRVEETLRNAAQQQGKRRIMECCRAQIHELLGITTDFYCETFIAADS